MSDPEVAMAICSGVAKAAAVIDDKPYYHEAIAEWSADPGVHEIVRVPLNVARHFLFKRWPGRDAAIAALAAPVQP